MTNLGTLTVEEKLKYYSRMTRNLTAEIARLKRRQHSSIREKKASFNERINVLVNRKTLLQLEKEEILIQCKREDILNRYPWLGDTIHTNIFTTYDPATKA